jgi:hypothetical protein
VAEQFENDGSPVSTIVKGVKRAMAGEYSRELSTKVFIGQCRLIELGFRQGGHAGYGYRRVMIDQAGEFKGELKHGERKCISTYRVVLVPGPAEEVELVNNMYRWLVHDKLTVPQIVRRLNGMQMSPEPGLPWTFGRVRQILTNEKYIGNNLYNRQSFKLKKVLVKNLPEMWIRKDGAFEAIVPIETFLAAQQIILARMRRYSDSELITKLRELYQEKGTLSSLLIDGAPDLPSASVYSSRFGSLTKAYEQVGFRSERDLDFLEVNRRLRQLHPEIMDRTQHTIAKMGADIWRDPKTDLLHLNQELVISLVLARCQVLPSGRQRWRIRSDPAHYAPDITVAVRLDHRNENELDYFLLPRMDLPEGGFQVTDQNQADFACFRFDDLSFLYGLTERQRFPRRT